MAIFDLYSKRQQRLRGDVPDVYIYEALPEALIVQIIHIWKDVLGNDYDYRTSSNVQQAYQFIVKTLCREYGLFQLPTADAYERHYRIELANHLLTEPDIEKKLDVVELSFNVINAFTRTHSYLKRRDYDDLADQAIEELNNRFKEHGVGFQFVENKIIRVDSELIHAQAVKPALRLLNETYYQGAQEEFLSAYEHYRQGKNKEALNDCLKAFESTMKAICEKRGWDYETNMTASKLIDVCFKNELISPFWSSQMSSLKSLLKSSIPTVRNKLSGHGQGSTPTEVPAHLIAYTLHMTASTLVFLTSAEKELG